MLTVWSRKPSFGCQPRRGIELMAQWQAVALPNPKGVRDYMDLRFVNEVMAELTQK